MKLSSLWGKAHPLPDAIATTHPLLAHSLDVAAVAMLLPDADRLGLDRRWLGFAVSLHDVGKISRAFQGQAPRHWPSAVLGDLFANPPGYPHDAMGLHLLTGPLKPDLEPAFLASANGRRSWINPILQALAGHHGRPPAIARVPGDLELGDAAIGAAKTFVALMLDVFRPPPLSPPGRDRAVARLAWQIAGLVTLADWIGSRQQWFGYVAQQEVEAPAAYFLNHALPRAARAIERAGMSHAGVAPFRGIRHLFRSIERPTPVQAWAQQAPLPAGPILAVIEDMTGSGKTEAALTLAHRLMAERETCGLFLALPTMATAGAMFRRLDDSYHRLYGADARPSLALAHGRAALDPRFRAAIARDEMDAGTAPIDPADEAGEAHCAAWLADDRRRALLAQVGVGTIDQAVLAVLPVRHAPLRQRGLANKVLIVDEAHAFDPYMNRELRALLLFHAALGGSAILLSATLPMAVRQGLVDAFREGLQAPRAALANTAYPLATLVSGREISETACEPREGVSRRVTVTRLADTDAAIMRIEQAVAAGAAVAWVRNTVDDAIESAAALSERGLSPLLFHARFAMIDRLRIEAEVLGRFGPSGDPDGRPGVLVATQVVEQSLDLDFDLLVTDLAPMDLLIQRAGRLWRHARPARAVPGPEFLVLSPPPVPDPAADWIKAQLPGTAAVYRDPALLWRTARLLFARGEIATPDDMRALIEAAADREAPGAVPTALARADEAAIGKAMSSTGLASQNVLTPWMGYSRGDGAWEPDTRTPTRIEEQESVVLRLAVERDGELGPYAVDPDPRRAWALSEVGMARHRIATSSPPPGLERAAIVARGQWGRWERESPSHLLAVLIGKGDTWEIRGADERDAPVVVGYSATKGLFRLSS